MAGGKTYKTSRTYDDHRRLDVLTYPEGFQIKHGYSTNTGGLTSVRNAATTGSGAGTKYWELTEATTAEAAEKLGNGLETRFGFDARTGWLGSITTKSGAGAVVQSLGYTYHRNDNLKARTETVRTASGTEQHDEAFLYDGADRLVGWYAPGGDGKPSGAGFDVTYGYDALGNLRSRDVKLPAGAAGGDQALAYKYDQRAGSNAGPHGVTEAPWGELGYGGRGNQTKRPGGETVAYTSFDVPKTIKVMPAGTTTAQEVARFEYDAFGGRVMKRAVDGGATRSTLYVDEAAYAEVPSPRIQFNFGHVYTALSRDPEALLAFERFLAAPDAASDPELRHEAERSRDMLRARVGLLEVICRVEGAEVVVDGRVVGTTPLARAVPVPRPPAPSERVGPRAARRWAPRRGPLCR